MTSTHDTAAIDVGYDVEITRVDRRTGVGGAWVAGRLSGHRFEALVFPERAQRGEWEYRGSRISKLWLQRLTDRRVVFSWDRGLDVPAADKTVEAIVDFLAEGLADHVYAR